MEQSILKADLVLKNMSRNVKGAKSLSKVDSQDVQASQSGKSNSISFPASNAIKVRTFVFTMNNPAQKGWDVQRTRKRLLEQGAKTFVFQEEIGESGTHHYQGVVSFENPRSFKAIVKTFTDDSGKPLAHWEKCRNLTASIRYCTKLDTRRAGTEPVCYGVGYENKQPVPSKAEPIARPFWFDLLSTSAKQWYDDPRLWDDVMYHVKMNGFEEGKIVKWRKHEFADLVNDIVSDLSKEPTFTI